MIIKYNNELGETMKLWNIVKTELLPASIEDRQKLVPVVIHACELSFRARAQGILSLAEITADYSTNISESIDIFYHTIFSWATDGVEPDIIEDYCCVILLSRRWTPIEYLAIILISQAATSIQSGSIPDEIANQLLSWLGFELADEVKDAIAKSCALENDGVDDFYSMLLSTSDTVVTEPTLWDNIVASLDNRGLRRIMREISLSTLAPLLMFSRRETIERALGAVGSATRYKLEFAMEQLHTTNNRINTIEVNYRHRNFSDNLKPAVEMIRDLLANYSLSTYSDSIRESIDEYLRSQEEVEESTTISEYFPEEDDDNMSMEEI